MPSPVGHALGGVAAGWLIGRPLAPPWHPLERARTLTFAGLGMAADLDLLVGVHRGPTHSVGATIAVGLAAWLVLRNRRNGPWLAFAAAAAYGSHVLLDWLGADSSPPIGLQALWPWSSAYVQAPVTIFLAVSRRVGRPDLFWAPNAYALARELLILLPLAAMAGYLRVRRRGTGAGATLALALTTVVHAAMPQPSLGDRHVTQDDDQNGAYLRGVVAYRAGDFERALETVASMQDEDVARQTAALKGDPALLRAAAMIQTELAFRRASAHDIDDADLHMARARSHVRELRRRESAGAFERGWFLLISAELQADRAVDVADAVLEEARATFPHDPELLVASGAAAELTTFTTGRQPAVAESGRTTARVDPDREVQEGLESAARFLQEAVAVAPADDEGHLRFGRVLDRLGKADRAIEHLDTVRRRTGDVNLRYLAALFQGAAEMSRHRPEHAAECYQGALQAVRAQSAWVGLSAAVSRPGRRKPRG